MKKIKLIALVLVGTFMSCDNFLDVNESPNNPNVSQVSPELSLAAAQTTSFSQISRGMNNFGNLLMNNWGYDVNSFAVTNSPELSYSIDSNFYSGTWDGIFLPTANFTNIINYDAKPNYENHKAIALICKSYYFQILVDAYGDIPYTFAHLGASEATPSYDDDKAVYRDLYDKLDVALDLISNSPNAISVGSEDVIFGGNMNQWVKFANTLKLKMLMRQSDLAKSGTDAETTAYLAAKFPTLVGVQFLDADATINPGYSNSRRDTQNPFYNLMFQIDETTPTAFFRQFRASDYNADNLNDPIATDPRRGQLFQLIGGAVVGVLQGDNAVVNGGTAPLVISAIGPGQVVSSAQDGYMISLAESLLLQAEAAHEGYLPGSAQGLFDAAITASCAQLGVSPGAYIANVNTVVGKGYGANAVPADQIKAIMYQKNIALQGTQNTFEAFVESTRTGVIDLIPGTIGTPTQSNRPRRLLYPTSELTGNSANVPAQGNVFTTGAFWFAY